jgi:hypothetical protein
MPLDWPDDIVARIRQYTNRNIIFRPKNSKNKKVRIPVFHTRNMTIDNTESLDSQLNRAHSVVTWNSPSISVKAVMMGLPVFIDAPTCIAKSCSAGKSIADIEKPRVPNTAELMIKLNSSLWSVSEINQGIPFTKLLEQVSEGFNISTTK